MACLDIHQTVSEAAIDPVTSIPGNINNKIDVTTITSGNTNTTTTRGVAVMATKCINNTKKGTVVVAIGDSGFEVAGIVLGVLFPLVIDRIKHYADVAKEFRETIRYRRFLEKFMRDLEIEHTVYSNTLHLLMSRAGVNTKSDTVVITARVLARLPKRSRQAFLEGCKNLHQILEELEGNFPQYEKSVVGINFILAKLCH